MKGITLTPIQVSSKERLLKQKKMIIADPTGSGKTIACLASYEECPMPNKHLFVIATKSSAPSWVRDIKYFPGLKHRCFSADDKDLAGNMEAQDKIDVDWDVTILRNSSIKLFSKIIYKIWKKQIVLVVEEAHTAKNPKSQIGAAVRSAVKYAQYAWLITATPILNHIEDIYNIINIIYPGVLGTLQQCLEKYTVRSEKRIRYLNGRTKPNMYKTWLHKDLPGRKTFRGLGKGLFEWDETTKGVSYFRVLQEVVGYQNLDDLARRIAPYYTRTVRELDLVYNIIDIPLSEDEEKQYCKLAQGIISKYDEERIFSQRLPDLQLYVDNAIETTSNTLEDRVENKDLLLSSKEKSFIDYLTTIIDKKPILIFTPFRHTQTRLGLVVEHYLRGKYKNVLYINGSSKGEDRGYIADEHKVGDVVIITDAGGMSLNFDKTDEIIFYGLPFSIGSFIQTVGRITRESSAFDKFKVTIFSVTNTIDEYKLNLIKLFSSVVLKVLSGKAEPLPDEGEITRDAIIKMRKDLLWRSRK